MQLYRALILRSYTQHDMFCELVSVFCNHAQGFNMVTKGCQTSLACVGAVACCEGDLCNSAVPTGPSVILLLVASVIITLFL
uniref:UPAR/Ly6 domain-containing protein n=1 Tax=Seriola lalandi dorsalis TaxID=1841481 RepID=A0A3B4WVR8_SERLL